MNEEKVLDVFEKYEASLNDLFLGKEKLEVGDIVNALNIRAEKVRVDGEGFMASYASPDLRRIGEVFLTIAAPKIKELQNKLEVDGISSLNEADKIALDGQLHCMITDYRGDKDAASKLREALNLQPVRE